MSETDCKMCSTKNIRETIDTKTGGVFYICPVCDRSKETPEAVSA